MGTGSRRLDEAVLTGARSLCLGAGIRDIAVPLCTPVLLYEGGVQGGYTLHGHVASVTKIYVSTGLYKYRKY